MNRKTEESEKEENSPFLQKGIHEFELNAIKGELSIKEAQVQRAQLLANLVVADSQITRRIHHAYVTACSSNYEWLEAQQGLKDMLQDGLPADDNTVRALFWKYCQTNVAKISEAKTFEDADNLMHGVVKELSTVCENLLEVKVIPEALAVDIIAEMSTRLDQRFVFELLPTLIKILNVPLMMLGEQALKHIFEAQVDQGLGVRDIIHPTIRECIKEYIRKIEKRRSVPDVVVEVLIKLKRYDEAVKRLVKFQRGIPGTKSKIGIEVHNKLVAALIHDGYIGFAWHIVCAMKYLGPLPNHETYGLLVEGLALYDEKNLERNVLEVMDDMSGTKNAYVSLTCLYANLDDLRTAEDMLKLVHRVWKIRRTEPINENEKGAIIKSKRKAYLCIMYAYARQGVYKKVISTFKMMSQILDPTSEEVGHLVRCMLKSKAYYKILKILEVFRKQNLLNRSIVEQVMLHAAEADEFELCLRCIEIVEKPDSNRKESVPFLVDMTLYDAMCRMWERNFQKTAKEMEGHIARNFNVKIMPSERMGLIPSSLLMKPCKKPSALIMRNREAHQAKFKHGHEDSEYRRIEVEVTRFLEQGFKAHFISSNVPSKRWKLAKWIFLAYRPTKFELMDLDVKPFLLLLAERELVGKVKDRCRYLAFTIHKFITRNYEWAGRTKLSNRCRTMFVAILAKRFDKAWFWYQRVIEEKKPKKVLMARMWKGLKSTVKTEKEKIVFLKGLKNEIRAVASRGSLDDGLDDLEDMDLLIDKYEQLLGLTAAPEESGSTIISVNEKTVPQEKENRNVTELQYTLDTPDHISPDLTTSKLSE